MQFQMSTEVQLTGRNRQEQIDYLDGLIASLEGQMEEIDGRLNELEPRLLALQAEKEAVDVERTQLQRDQNVAAETHQALARKVAEERIVAESADQGVRLASRASVPVLPSGLGLLILVIVSGMVGVMTTIGVVLLLTWWRTAMEMPVEPEEERKRSAESSPERERVNQSGQPALRSSKSRF